MTQSAAFLLILLIAGDAIAEYFTLPIPGAALGLAALASGFALSGRPDKGSEELFDFAAPYFPLFFVPAAVGVVASRDVLAFAWVHIAAAIVIGTGVTIFITGLIAQSLFRQTAEKTNF